MPFYIKKSTTVSTVPEVPISTDSEKTSSVFYNKVGQNFYAHSESYLIWWMRESVLVEIARIRNGKRLLRKLVRISTVTIFPTLPI